MQLTSNKGTRGKNYYYFNLLQGYKAPEIETNSFGYDGKKVDIFALGILLFAMIFRSLPFVRTHNLTKAHVQ